MLAFQKKLAVVIRFLKSRLFAVSALSVLMAGVVAVVTFATNAVYIIDDGNSKLVLTMAKNPQKILAANNIQTTADDEIIFNGFDQKVGKITIKRAFDVEVVADGQTRSVTVTGGKVSDALRLTNTTLDNDDLINVDLQDSLEEGMQIVVNRVEYKTITKTETIPFSTTTKSSSLLKVGLQSILKPGLNGKKTATIQQVYIDGKLVEQTVLEEKVTKKPVSQVLLVGSKHFISPLPAFSGFELNSAGKPVKYKKIITGPAAAYSGGYGTASGLAAKVGHVAVDPRVIPYGTKLFITTPDNKYVYGYAIAADTGAALKQGKIVVDLYFSSYKESCLFGKKQVNIYVLE